jgi:CBS domain-containing protein
MKVESIMTKEPVCCTPSDSVQLVAQLMKQHDVGAIPVISDSVSRKLIGIITDRDLCVSAMADGKDPRITRIEPYYTKTVITCVPEDTLETCESRMKQHKIRRIPVVDRHYSCIGMIVQGDLARIEAAEVFREVVAEISKPSRKRPSPVIAA